MAHTIITKNSSTAGVVPSAGSLTKGELAVNVTDRRLYTKDNAGSVVEVGSGTSIIYRDNFTGDGSTVAFTLPRTPLNEELVDIYCDGVYQGKDTFSISGAVITFDEAPLSGASIEVMTFQSSPIGETAANYVSYTPAGTGAVATTVQSKLRETVSVLDFGADPTGVANSSAAFAAARAITNRYFIPPGTYILDASPDPFLDCFTSGNGVTLIVGGVSYNCSNAFAGPLRYVAASAVKTNIVHAKTGNIIQYWQDGSPGTATGFYRGLAFTTDSHWVQAQPSTNGGSTDILWQRSTLNADPGGNRFNETFEEANDRLAFSYATSASGSPAFDTYMRTVAGPSATMDFPALAPTFRQGWSMQNRAETGYKMSFVIGSDRHHIKDFAQTFTHMTFKSDGAVGFFGAGGVTRPTITGSRGGNAALTSLLTALSQLGLITDATTA